MDGLKNILATISKQLGSLGPTQKLLLLMLGVVMALSLLVVSQFSGQANYVSLLKPGTSDEQQNKVADVLDTERLHYKRENGTQIYVRSEDKVAIMARLMQEQSLASEMPDLVASMSKSPSWLNTSSDKRFLQNNFKQEQLSRIISEMDGIETAKVVLDIPEPTGLGMTARKPTAAVSVRPSGDRLSQRAVDAIVRAVAYSVSGLDPKSVTVMDLASGTSRRMQDEEEAGASQYRDYVMSVERHYKEKIQSMLRDYGNAVVEVTADVDFARVNSVIEKFLPPGEGTVSLPKKTTESTQSSSNGSTQGGEPGVGANIRADVATVGAGKGDRSETRQEDTEFQVHAGRQTDRRVDAGGSPTHLSASVGLPRGDIIAMLMREKAKTASAGGAGNAAGADAAAETPPTEQEITSRFESERAKLTTLILPLLKTRTTGGGTVEGELSIGMLSMDSSPSLANGLGGSEGSSGVMNLVLGNGGSGLIDKAVLGILGVVSLGLMLTMVRKATKKLHMPTTEELLGHAPPPTLPGADDIVGEADEGDAPMPGIEIGDDQLNAQKMREQVAELIKQKPDQAAKLLTRWIAVED